MKKNYFKHNGVGVAAIGKSGSSAIARAILFDLEPEYEVRSASGSTDNVERSLNRPKWQALVPKTQRPTQAVIPVRDPIERFRSACAQDGRTAQEQLLKVEAGEFNGHTRPTSDYLINGARLYKFPDQLAGIAAELGVDEIPAVNDSETNNGPKPDLAEEEIARVSVVYADDIALFESIENAGQPVSLPPAEATQAEKATKLIEIRAEREATWQDVLVTSFGVPFWTDAQTQLDVSTIINILEPEQVYEAYTCADGLDRDLTREQFQLAFYEGVVRKKTAFAVWRQKRDAVNAATTQAELQAI